MDAIQIVKRDHRAVEKLFKQLERAERAGRTAELGRVVERLVRELSVHATIEEQILYPALRRADPALDAEVLEALEEHHLQKLTLLELDGMRPEEERYGAKARVLMQGVRHHVAEEERDLLPRLRKAFAPRELRELGTLLEEARKGAPTRPHPGAPDTPPGNLLAGAVAALLDRGRDALRQAAGRGLKAAEGRARKMKTQARRAMASGRSMVKDLAGGERHVE